MGHDQQFHRLPKELVLEYAKAGAEECTKRGTRYRFSASDSHRGGVIRAAQKKLETQKMSGEVAL